MEDKTTQDDEITAIKSIYEEEDIFAFDEEKRTGKFFVKIIPLNETIPFNVNLPDEKLELKVFNLPPILLEFKLPDNYPSVNPPDFKLSSRWLNNSNLGKLCQKLDELWEQNSQIPILFTWISFLNDEIFDYLSIDQQNLIIENDNSIKTDARAFVETCSSKLLINYDTDQQEIKFNKSYFQCFVCFCDKLGKDCLKFNKCNHVFCNDCMRGYFESLIFDGNVKKLNCPQEKCESQALPSQVLSLVGEEIFKRYDSLLLKDALNNMLDIVYCPRANCQCAVIPEDTTLCRCPDCKNVFCALCRQTYHGIEPCKITSHELKEIVEIYKNGDAEAREKLVLKYGERRIKQAVEETSSMNLIESTSKKCPQCRSWMQKLDGCNKMTCSKCNCYFCWLCLDQLSKADPYSHYNRENSKCFEKLFEGVYQNDREAANENHFNQDQESDEDDEDEDDEDEFEDEHIIFELLDRL
ncbi:unnamed protein product [Brachionus calyciflorus]|uniref:RBR-type E3 ubiquitin transferase n=1 Tax=Brachionus calyciflorus TaxID=104777 RepID=A0A813UYK0_9BILA|nr:unnamed protein product [Brachionus calyciflorus]